MEYTVQKLGRLAGVSARTLRYYDEIGLLRPARVSSSGYRIYGRDEVDRLQQILFYRELGMGLEEIGEILSSPGFDRVKALRGHREQLLDRRSRLDALIANVEKTIEESEGSIVMTDQEKFEGFKQKLIEENEEKYGREIREKYGDEEVERSNRRMRNLSQEEFAEFETLGEQVLELLKKALESGDPAGAEAQQAAELHRRWLTLAWGRYSAQVHAGIARMYTDDARFATYYDKVGPGAAALLRDAILIYTGEGRK